jgi:REP element-mobilizing transposase RayT
MQTSFLPKKDLRFIKAMSHGGAKLKTRRKIKRPLIPNAIHHVVLKSSKAQGKFSFYTHKQLVTKLLNDRARKYFVEILEFVNMGNHLHLKIRFKDRRRCGQFLKSFAALVARKVTGASKSNPFGRFWDGLVYTRVLLTKFEELGLRGYFEGNHRQRELSYSQREQYLKAFNEYMSRLRRTRAATLVNL